MRGVTWDILMCSIWHRTEQLDRLLRHLEDQLCPGVGVRVYRDNLDVEYGEKCQRLLDSSRAEYVSFLDDDDWVEDDFVPVIMDALSTRPDYVGFKVKFTRDGQPAVPVTHSIQACRGWVDKHDELLRDIVHFNPIRRELALDGTWAGGDGADRRWANQVREKGRVRTERFINRELHHYQFRWDQTFTRSSIQAPLEEEPPRPRHRWVTWLEDQFVEA